MKVFWAGLCTAILLGAVATGTYGVLNITKTISSSGTVSTINVEVYSDSACTQTATNINWGNLSPGTSATYTLYIKNTGNTAETLSMATNNWSPQTVSQYITITWNRNNAVLEANQMLQATLTLTVSSFIDNSITAFSNQIIISGTIAPAPISAVICFLCQRKLTDTFYSSFFSSQIVFC
ncbi:MAG: hypothetical protein M1540_07550 [Candidatus Bathyarchaeota archaeon]|nr:hypothetical protein [Candidatus Bathyarchaeota archaeon]